MKKPLLGTFVFLSLGLILRAPDAHAWGQYGHEQGNDAAITLLGTSNGLGACLDQARYVVRRMAVVPDIEWKTDMRAVTPEMRDRLEQENQGLVAEGKKPKPVPAFVLSDADYNKRIDDDKYEHPMHFDEVDAWVPHPHPGDIANLPAGEYRDVYSQYRDRLKQNAAFVAQMDPSKRLADPSNPTVNEVTDHGTAPWRAQQMWRLGVDALRRNDVKAAILYLGTMGHYVCDMSQPFHATLDFDGEAYHPAAAGIHHQIDTGVLPDKPKDNNEVYTSFAATESAVLAAGRAAAGSPVAEEQIPHEMLGMIDAGYPDVENFLKAYSDVCARAQSGQAAASFNSVCNPDSGDRCTNTAATAKPVRKKSAHASSSTLGEHATRTRRTPAGVRTRVSSTDVGHGGNGGHGAVHNPSTSGPYCVTQPATEPGGRSETPNLPEAFVRQYTQQVLPRVEERIGQCASLLSRMWASAYAAAGSPSLSGCGSVQFDQSFAIQNYPHANNASEHGYLPDGYTPGHR